jgi:hypothetical protein
MPVIMEGKKEWLGGVESVETQSRHRVHVAERLQLERTGGLPRDRWLAEGWNRVAFKQDITSRGPDRHRYDVRRQRVRKP